MNNNRNNNNRRRGRGNRNQGGGGGNQGNRIDSRARGNAPQLLEKYKKLAQDAQHNGDRVQAEYYLQFADHYFRVIADNKLRQDEHRGRRPDEREFEDEGGDEDDFDARPRRDAGQNNRRPRNNRRDEREHDGREAYARDDDAREAEPAPAEMVAYEPAENPFMRNDDSESEGEPRPRRGRKPRRPEGAKPTGEGEIDAAVLPPSFAAVEASGEEKPAPRRRRRKLDDEGPVSAVG